MKRKVVSSTSTHHTLECGHTQSNPITALGRRQSLFLLGIGANGYFNVDRYQPRVGSLHICFECKQQPIDKVDDEIFDSIMEALS